MRVMRYCVLALMLLILPLCIVGCDKSRDYSASIDADDKVKLTLFTYDGKGESHFGLMNLGHSFLSVENISDEDIIVGKMTLGAGEEIALGTWSVKAHFGLWYNLEGNYTKAYRKYDGRISVSIGLTLDDLDKVNEYIKDNDHWGVYKNCSYFALNLYNLVASESEHIDTPLIYTPGYIAGIIKKFDTCETNKVIHCEDKFGYFDGDEYIEYSFSEGIDENI